MLNLRHSFLGDLSVNLTLPSAVPRHDAVGEQRRVGLVVGARGGRHSTDMTRAGGAAGAAGRAAFRRRQVVLDYSSGWSRSRKVSWEGCVPWRDGVSVDGDKALMGLGHTHRRPGGNWSHLSRRSDRLSGVEVPSGGGSKAGVAEVADGTGA